MHSSQSIDAEQTGSYYAAMSTILGEQPHPNSQLY